MQAMPTWLLQLSQQDFPGAHQNVDVGLVALSLQAFLCYLVYRSTARQTKQFHAKRLLLCQEGEAALAFGKSPTVVFITVVRAVLLVIQAARSMCTPKWTGAVKEHR